MTVRRITETTGLALVRQAMDFLKDFGALYCANVSRTEITEIVTNICENLKVLIKADITIEIVGVGSYSRRVNFYAADELQLMLEFTGCIKNDYCVTNMDTQGCFDCDRYGQVVLSDRFR